MCQNSLIYMKYASITLVDVEKSFSIYKNVLAPIQIHFSKNNLTKYIIYIVV